MSLAIPAGAADTPGLIAERNPGDDPVIAYVCAGTRCSAPTAARDELEAQLGATEYRAALQWH
jgi:hypothetical protein